MSTQWDVERNSPKLFRWTFAKYTVYFTEYWLRHLVSFSLWHMHPSMSSMSGTLPICSMGDYYKDFLSAGKNDFHFSRTCSRNTISVWFQITIIIIVQDCVQHLWKIADIEEQLTHLHLTIDVALSLHLLFDLLFPLQWSAFTVPETLLQLFNFPSLDFNECAIHTHGCHANATCTNTVGSYSCACIRRFTGNGKNCTST